MSEVLERPYTLEALQADLEQSRRIPGFSKVDTATPGMPEPGSVPMSLLDELWEQSEAGMFSGRDALYVGHLLATQAMPCTIGYRGSPVPMAAYAQLHPTMSRWEDEVAHVLRSEKDQGEGTAAYFDADDAIVRALFHPWQPALKGIEHAIARFRNPYTGRRHWLVNREAAEAVHGNKNAQGYVFRTFVEPDDYRVTQLGDDGQFGDVRLGYSAPMSAATPLTGEDLPDMVAIDIERGTMTRAEMQRILGDAVMRLEKGEQVGTTIFQTSRTEMTHLPYGTWYNPDQTPFRPLHDTDRRRSRYLYTVRDGNLNDLNSALAIHMLDYVDTYGVEPYGTARDASEFVCAQPVNGTLFYERMSGFLKEGLQPGPDHKFSVVDCFSCGNGTAHVAGIGQIKKDQKNRAIVGMLYMLENHRGRGMGTEIWHDMNTWLHSIGFQGRIDVMVTRDVPAVGFYAKLQFEPWEEDGGGPIWRNGNQLVQSVMSRGFPDPKLGMKSPFKGTPPMSWPPAPVE